LDAGTNDVAERAKFALKISVIIPTLNEAAHLPALLEYCRTLHGVGETIVGDGGSIDDTVNVSHVAGAIVVASPRNRGAQLNAGARAATGEILWFLHADARPHADSARYILMSCRNSQTCGGNFRLHFDSNARAARAIEVIAQAQRRLGIYYGDSGIFVRRDVFDKLGGFREWPLFEDYDFARRLERYARQHGCHTEYSPLPLLVSARRLQHRPWRTVMLWAFLQLLFFAGVSPYRLARLYHR
jgi:rSAM/selenodomain-associated transferase 2